VHALTLPADCPGRLRASLAFAFSPEPETLKASTLCARPYTLDMYMYPNPSWLCVPVLNHAAEGTVVNDGTVVNAQTELRLMVLLFNDGTLLKGYHASDGTVI
jgi:hypothetical protein